MGDEGNPRIDGGDTMTRALTFAIPMSLAIWGVIGALAWYAPEVLLGFAFAILLLFIHDVATEW
jgi:hypothetical protein